MIFFGALITGCTEYRATYYQAWAEASKHLSVLFGATMTFLLLSSSFTMAPGSTSRGWLASSGVD